MSKDKCRIENADICMRCNEAWETRKNNGLKWIVCQKCSNTLKELLEHYKKHGFYLMKKEN